jgi:transposase
LTVVCHSQTHLIAALDVCVGPCQDSPQFPPVMREAAKLIQFDRLLADKGYDAEHNHILARKELKISSTIIAVKRNTNGTRQWPKSKYRRQLKRMFPKLVYGQRWQVESLFSRNKRLLGSSLKSRNWESQVRECHLRVLTHNFMIMGVYEK